MRTKTKDYTLPVYAVELSLVAERTIQAPTITGPAAAAQLACEYLARADREHFICILLATSGRVIGIHTAAIGSISSAVVRPADVFKCAILGNAAAVIFGHNHPSGALDPSAEDIQMTRRLVEAGRILDIPVRDSLIVTAGGQYTSLAERGLV